MIDSVRRDANGGGVVVGATGAGMFVDYSHLPRVVFTSPGRW